jgi:hypothetical protein
MATQRYISTSFWDDEWVRSLDPSEKFVYLYLMTNPLTNIAGVYKITIARICFDTGYNEDTVTKVLDRFQTAGKAYMIDGYMILPTWPKHQKWRQRSKIKAGIVSILENLHPELLGNLKKIGYTYPIDTISIPYVYDSNYSDTDTDLNSDTDTDIPATSQPVDNSEPEKPVVVADVKNQLKELPFDMTLSKTQSAQVVKELNSRSLTPPFLSYLAEHIRGQPNIRNPGGLMWKILSSLDQYEELIEKYRSWSPPRPKVPKPKVCPRCGSEFSRMTASAAECDHCGIFDWDPDVGWIQDGEIF